jgi:DNA-directed RNA polymerase specialized sigma24 family protein
MTPTIAAEQQDAFEQALLASAEVLYGVALTLTHNTQDARRLTRTTLLRAWQLREKAKANVSTKWMLLNMLRNTYVKGLERKQRIRLPLGISERRCLAD